MSLQEQLQLAAADMVADKSSNHLLEKAIGSLTNHFPFCKEAIAKLFSSDSNNVESKDDDGNMMTTSSDGQCVMRVKPIDGGGLVIKLSNGQDDSVEIKMIKKN
jgi:hypothetical protein